MKLCVRSWLCTMLPLELLTAGIVRAAPLPVGAPEDAGISSQRLERLTQTMQRVVDSGELAGTVVMVARKGKLVYAKAFGARNKAAGVPMADDAIFRVYSMTKPVVSVAAMMLDEEGRLSLDEPIAKYIPEFKDMKVGVESFDPATGVQSFTTVPAKRQITVQDLLRHTSGLTYGVLGQKTQVKTLYNQASIFSQKWTLETFCKELAKLPLQFEPGTVWEYGHSTDVLGRVIEVASGQPLDQFLAERILKPLKMVDTGFYVPADKHPRIAQPSFRPGERGAPLGLFGITGRDESNAAEPAAARHDHRLQHLGHAAADHQVGVADDAGADPRLAVAAAGAHRRDAVGELDLADRTQLDGPLGAIHRQPFQIHGRDDVVPAVDIGQQRVSDLMRAHLGLQIVGGHVRGGHEHPVFSRVGRFDAAVEEVGDVRVLLGLGESEIVHGVSLHDVGEASRERLRFERHRQVQRGVVAREAGI